MPSVPTEGTLASTLVLGLAAFRLTRLVTTDRVTAPVRDHVAESFRRAGMEQARYLLGCDWCVGVWAAGAVLALESTRTGRRANRLLAVAALVGIGASYT